MGDPLSETSAHPLLLSNRLHPRSKSFSRWKKKARRTGAARPTGSADVPGPWLATETSRSLPAKAEGGFRCCQGRKVTVIFLRKGRVMDNTQKYFLMSGDLLTSAGSRRRRYTGRENILLTFGPGSQLHTTRRLYRYRQRPLRQDWAEAVGAAIGQPLGILPSTQEWLG